MRYAPLFFWIGVIFYLSSAQGSMSKTSLFVRPLLEWIFPAASEATLLVYHGYIRKFAHFAEYAALAFFAFRAFSSSSRFFLRRHWPAVSLLLVIGVAAADELNQSFIAARTGAVSDVLLDAAGGLTALLVLRLVVRWRAGRSV